MRRRTSARRPDIPSCGRTAAAGCRPWKLREILAGELLDIPALLIGPFGDIPLGKGIVMFVDHRVAHGGVDDLPHGLLVVELHLDFLGMDIDVDPFGVDRKEEEIGGETGIGNQLLISFQHRLAQVLVAEIASVDEEVLLGIALFGRRRTPHEPVDANDRRVRRYTGTSLSYNSNATAGLHSATRWNSVLICFEDAVLFSKNRRRAGTL